MKRILAVIAASVVLVGFLENPAHSADRFCQHVLDGSFFHLKAA